MTRAFYLTAIVLCLLTAYIAAMPECGVEPGQPCSTDTECACLHGAEE